MLYVRLYNAVFCLEKKLELFNKSQESFGNESHSRKLQSEMKNENTECVGRGTAERYVE